MALAIAVTGVFAQEATDKKAVNYLPEANDWALSIDATPFLKYAGNFLSSAGNNAPTFNSISSQNIVGRYFKDDKTAYRGILRIGFDNTTTDNSVNQYTTTAPVYPAVPSKVTDKMAVNNFNVALGAGIEKRRGSKRLQGYYGADAMIGLSSNSTNYTYGNALTTTNNIVNNSTYTSNFGSNYTTANGYPGVEARVTHMSSGMAFSIGVRGFVGVEYYIVPKISLGGELGWGLGFTANGTSETKTESVGTPTGGAATVGTQDIKSPNGHNFWLDTDNNNPLWEAAGAINLTFHF